MSKKNKTVKVTPVKIKSSTSKFALGTVYETTGFEKINTSSQATFNIGNNFCLLKNCAHLGGGDWEIVEEKNIFTRAYERLVKLLS